MFFWTFLNTFYLRSCIIVGFFSFIIIRVTLPVFDIVMLSIELLLFVMWLVLKMLGCLVLLSSVLLEIMSVDLLESSGLNSGLISNPIKSAKR